MPVKHTLKPYELLEFSYKKRLKQLYLAAKFPRITDFAMKYFAKPIMVRPENSFNQSWRYGYQAAGGGYIPPDELKVHRLGLKAIIDNFHNAIEASKNGEPVVWVEWVISNEILRAFDVPAFCPEALNVFGNLMGTDYTVHLVEEAERNGVTIEHCSSMKSMLGAWMLDQLPKPHAIIGSSHPCDTGVSVYPSIEMLTGAPLYVLDSPYWRDEKSLQYYEKNVWGEIKFLEKTLKRKIDWDKLKQTLEGVNQFNYYLGEITNMYRAVPCPGSIYTLLFSWVTRTITIGAPELPIMAKQLYEIIKARFDKGEGILKDERIRVIWFDIPFGHYLDVFKWMEREFGAVVVADFIGKVWTPSIDTSSEESMVRDLARSHLYIAMGRQCHGPAEFILDELQEIIDEYSGDCFIFTRHNGCKHGWAALKLKKDLCKKAGLPALLMSSDGFDKRLNPEPEAQKQITAFFKSNGLG